jgi:hypothetical protein
VSKNSNLCTVRRKNRLMPSASAGQSAFRKSEMWERAACYALATVRYAPLVQCQHVSRQQTTDKQHKRNIKYDTQAAAGSYLQDPPRLLPQPTVVCATIFTRGGADSQHPCVKEDRC